MDDVRADHTSTMRLIGSSDQGGRPDGVQIMVSVVDVRDPARPRPVGYVAAAHNTWTLHLQAHDDLLLVVLNKDMFAQPDMADERNYYKGSVDHHTGSDGSVRDFSAGKAVYDISRPERPRQIGFMPVEETGLHRIWYVGGR